MEGQRVRPDKNFENDYGHAPPRRRGALWKIGEKDENKRAIKSSTSMRRLGKFDVDDLAAVFGVGRVSRGPVNGS